MSTALALHAATTLAMTGLIWFVQRVHYPLFGFAAGDGFPAFARAHQQRTGSVVGPLMLVEMATAILLVAGPWALGEVRRIWAGAGLALLVALWLSTAFVQIPLHRRLLRGFDRRAARLLVRTNWFRTVAWSLRSVIAVKLLAP